MRVSGYTFCKQERRVHELISNDLRDGDKLPHRHVFNAWVTMAIIFTASGVDDVSCGTKSFVVTCYDPDAPTGSGWWHWVVVIHPLIPAYHQGFGSGLVAMPDGVLQTRTDFGKTGYDGAAPPKGETHRYIFTVHALDIERIDVDEGASGAMVGFNVHFHSLGAPRLLRCLVNHSARWRNAIWYHLKVLENNFLSFYLPVCSS
ncbi:kinase inhibitor [Escherichia coli]